MKNISKYLDKNREYNKVSPFTKVYDEAINIEQEKTETPETSETPETPTKPKELYDEYLVDNAHKDGQFIFNSSKPHLIICIFCFIFFMLTIYFMAINPLIFKAITNSYPIMMLILLINIIICFALIYGSSTNYLLNLYSRKLIKQYKFYSSVQERITADFSDIKLVGVSTVFSLIKEVVGASKYSEGKVVYYVVVSNKIVAILGSKRKIVVLEEMPSLAYPFDEIKNITSPIEELNSRALAAAKIIGCLYIPCDGSSKIEIKNINSNDVDSLIELIPKEKQLPEIDFDYKPDSK